MLLDCDAVAPKPIAVALLTLPVIFAKAPKAVLLLPVLFDSIVCLPMAVLPLPVVVE